jgi:hypothetical protein
LKSRSFRVLSAVLLLGLAALGSCSDDHENQVLSPRAFWESHGITKYRYQFKQACFCTPVVTVRVRITVEDDVITSVLDAATEAPIDARYWSFFQTIDQMFDFMARADRVDEVQYDDEYGYPRSAKLTRDLHATDSAWWAEADSLEVLESSVRR